MFKFRWLSLVALALLLASTGKDQVTAPAASQSILLVPSDPTPCVPGGKSPLVIRYDLTPTQIRYCNAGGTWSGLGTLGFASNTTGSTAFSPGGSNCPASNCTTPYTWFVITTADGSTAYIPAFK